MSSEAGQALVAPGAVAELLAAQAKRLVEQAAELSDEQRAALPPFRGSWQRADLEEYLARLQEAVRTPAIFQSRELLKQVGLAADRIPGEVLEDTSMVRDLLNQLERIEPFRNTATSLVTSWLMDANVGVEQAVTRLAAVEKPTLERIDAAKLRKDIKAWFLSSALAGRGSAVDRAERLAATLDHLSEYKISVPSRIESIEAIEASSDQLLSKVRDLEEVYSVPRGELMPTVRGKPLDEAIRLLTAKHGEASETFESLLKQWGSMAQLLSSLGEPPGEEPRTLDGLREGLERIRRACEAKIGSAGTKLLEFFNAAAPFPSDLSVEEIRDGLTRLRPLILAQRGS